MSGQVGPRGLAILVLAGITGILLAILGWSNRGTGLVAPSVGLGAGSASSRTATASAAATARPSPTQPPAATATQPVQPSAATSVGPLLSSEPYASDAYLVWPGALSAAAQEAMSGLSISVARRAGGISVEAGFTGGAAPPARFYAGGAMVYVIETALGDDSGHFDYNLGDDGLVVTNRQGQIVT
jgi:hypothetical protein